MILIILLFNVYKKITFPNQSILFVGQNFFKKHL